MLIPVFLAKVAGALVIYFRNNPNTDGVSSKLLGVFLEFFVGLMLLAILLAYSLRCLVNLPSNNIFLPDEDAEFLYYYDSVDYGNTYKVRSFLLTHSFYSLRNKTQISFRIPYTSFFAVILSGIASFYIAWVHWRMSVVISFFLAYFCRRAGPPGGASSSTRTTTNSLLYIFFSN